MSANIQVSALNRDIYDALRAGFVAAGFEIFAVVPASRFQELCELKDPAQILAFVAKHLQAVKALSLVYVPSAHRDVHARQTQLSQEHTWVLVIGFILFLCLLGLVTMLVLKSEQPTKVVVSPAPQADILRTTPSPSPTTSSLPALE